MSEIYALQYHSLWPVCKDWHKLRPQVKSLIKCLKIHTCLQPVLYMSKVKVSPIGATMCWRSLHIFICLIWLADIRFLRIFFWVKQSNELLFSLRNFVDGSWGWRLRDEYTSRSKRLDSNQWNNKKTRSGSMTQSLCFFFFCSLE